MSVRRTNCQCVTNYLSVVRPISSRQIDGMEDFYLKLFLPAKSTGGFLFSISSRQIDERISIYLQFLPAKHRGPATSRRATSLHPSFITLRSTLSSRRRRPPHSLVAEISSTTQEKQASKTMKVRTAILMAMMMMLLRVWFLCL